MYIPCPPPLSFPLSLPLPPFLYTLLSSSPLSPPKLIELSIFSAHRKQHHTASLPKDDRAPILRPCALRGGGQYGCLVTGGFLDTSPFTLFGQIPPSPTVGLPLPSLKTRTIPDPISGTNPCLPSYPLTETNAYYIKSDFLFLIPPTRTPPTHHLLVPSSPSHDPTSPPIPVIYYSILSATPTPPSPYTKFLNLH